VTAPSFYRKEYWMVTKVNLSTKEYRGLSTDEKPIRDVGNGSEVYEMDTGKTYYFDAEGEQWVTPENEDEEGT